MARGGAERKLTPQRLQSLHSGLQKFSSHKTAKLVEELREISELILWAEKHDESMLNYFFEANVLRDLIAVRKHDSPNVQSQLIQTMGILINNCSQPTTLYYLLSANSINHLITARLRFDSEEVNTYFASFLKSLALRLNKSTVQFFIDRSNGGYRIPLYDVAVSLYSRPDSMVRTSVRTVVLRICEECDDRALDVILFGGQCGCGFLRTILRELEEKCLELNELISAHCTARSPEQLPSLTLSSADQDVSDQLLFVNDLLRLPREAVKEVVGNHVLRWSATLIEALDSHLQTVDTNSSRPTPSSFSDSASLRRWEHEESADAVVGSPSMLPSGEISASIALMSEGVGLGGDTDDLNLLEDPEDRPPSYERFEKGALSSRSIASELSSETPSAFAQNLGDDIMCPQVAAYLLSQIFLFINEPTLVHRIVQLLTTTLTHPRSKGGHTVRPNLLLKGLHSPLAPVKGACIACLLTLSSNKGAKSPPPLERDGVSGCRSFQKAMRINSISTLPSTASTGTSVMDESESLATERGECETPPPHMMSPGDGSVEGGDTPGPVGGRATPARSPSSSPWEGGVLAPDVLDDLLALFHRLGDNPAQLRLVHLKALVRLVIAVTDGVTFENLGPSQQAALAQARQTSVSGMTSYQREHVEKRRLAMGYGEDEYEVDEDFDRSADAEIKQEISTHHTEFTRSDHWNLETLVGSTKLILPETGMPPVSAFAHEAYLYFAVRQLWHDLSEEPERTPPITTLLPQNLRLYFEY